MSYDVGKATEGLENELWRRWSDEKFGELALLIVRGLKYVIERDGKKYYYTGRQNMLLHGKATYMLLQEAKNYAI